jgi:hypothetical protein
VRSCGVSEPIAAASLVESALAFELFLRTELRLPLRALYLPTGNAVETEHLAQEAVVRATQD